jgi:hypothetical protein
MKERELERGKYREVIEKKTERDKREREREG